MAKDSGMGARLYVTGVDLSGDTATVQIGEPAGTKAVTGIDKSAIERRLLLGDGSIGYGAHWNPTGAHVTLSALPRTDQPMTYVDKAVVGRPAASIIGKQLNYDGTRAADGGMDFTVMAQANGYGLEWGLMLTTGQQAFASASAGTALDYGAGVGTTNFGLQAWLHVFSIGSGSATVAIQSSTDNAATDAYANVTGAVFAAATAGGTAQRLETGRTQAVERWLRVNVTGTFTNLVAAVTVKRNLTEKIFFG